jgi:fructoselysine-6-P-deglycase FrlB-like protein
VLHLPLQWFNWYLGIARNHPISTRRYMGKVEF